MKWKAIIGGIVTLFSIGNNILAKTNGSGIINPSAQFGKTYYLGISGSKFKTADYNLNFSSDSDIVVMLRTMNRYANQEIKSGIIMQNAGINNVSDTLHAMLSAMTSMDRFVFHFAGASETTLLDSATGKSEIRLYLSAKEGELSEYFTLPMLKLWLDIIPAREQVIIIDGGETANLKQELIALLIDKDPNKILAEGRKREIITNLGYGYEIPSVKMGALTYSITKYIHNYRNYISPTKTKDSIVQIRKWNLVFNSILYGGIGNSEFQYKTQCILDSLISNRITLNLIREWEIAEILSGYKLKLSPDSAHGMRKGENIVLRNKPSNSNLNRMPKSYAFLVGMDKYQYMTPLHNPVFDVNAMNDLLKNKYHYETHLDTNCNSEQFYQSLNYFLDSVNFGPHDQLLVYIAGHGIYNEKQRTGGIAFVDAKPVKINPGMNNYIQHINLLNSLLNTKCNNIFVVLDVCYGGSLSVGINSEQSANACENTKPDSIFWRTSLPTKENKLVTKNLNCQNRIFLTSGGNEYVPDGTKGAHSPFSNALLSVLQENKERIISTADISSKVRKKIEDGSVKAPTPSYGKFGTNSTTTDFVLFTQ